MEIYVDLDYVDLVYMDLICVDLGEFYVEISDSDF